MYGFTIQKSVFLGNIESNRFDVYLCTMSTESYPDIFTHEATSSVWARIDKLSPNTPAKWGKMTVSKMLAHCCLPYEQALGINTQKPNPVLRLLVKLTYKKSMVNTVPYKQGLPTAPAFIIHDEREFEKEKLRLKTLIQQMEKMGRAHFEGKKQLTLGKLSSQEWNNLIYKHTDHHLRQFGV